MNTVKLVRIYSDAAGESHFSEARMELRATDFAPPAPPLDTSEFAAARRFCFVSSPPGWFGDWHPTPARQIFSILSGELEMTVSDGSVRRVGAGDLVLLEDVSGKGHVTKNVGNRDYLAMAVQLAD